MLYKFKSKVTGDVIMLQANGRRVLQIIGKASDDAAAAPGIILPEQMAAAITALEHAVSEEERMRAEAKQVALAAGVEVAPNEAISLRQRALPLLDMLRRCQQAGKEIVWNV